MVLSFNHVFFFLGFCSHDISLPSLCINRSHLGHSAKLAVVLEQLEVEVEVAKVAYIAAALTNNCRIRSHMVPWTSSRETPWLETPPPTQVHLKGRIEKKDRKRIEAALNYNMHCLWRANCHVL